MISLSASPPPPAPDLVKDVGIATFVADVVEASRNRPVIVDFWAPWCGPCKQLGPALEKLVRAQGGAVTLAKVNIDENPEIAQQMRIQSIPAVFVFYQAQPVDGFMGALPESQLKAWLEKLMTTLKLPNAATDDAARLKEALDEAAALRAAGSFDQAAALYAQILGFDPQNAAAYAGQIHCLIGLQDLARAKEQLDAAPESLAKDAALTAAATALTLAQEGQKAAQGRAAAEQKLAANPDDHAARFALALALFATGEKESAIDALIEIIRRARAWNDEAARKQLLKFFEALGPTDPLTITGRRRLSSVLFA